ncbi:MAG: RDD family protein [Cyanothece sp. SIO2G6]|nr:RDD family protein [Cyanothece sp. SIO2G6]
MDLFNKIKIRTPESIELEFTLAGIGNRAFALLIDYIILNLSLLLLFFSSLFLIYSIQLNEGFGFDTDSQWFIAIVALIIYGLYVGYFVGFETLWQGQTPGKRWIKIRVIRDNAQPIGLFQATLRSLLRPVDDILFVGFLLILFGKQEKRLGDWLASTLVVQAEAPTPANTQLALSADAPTLAQQLLDEYDLSTMLPDHFAIVREYLQRRSTLTPVARQRLSIQIAEQLQPLLGMTALPWGIDTEKFLEVVYLAYQRQAV